MRPGGRRTGVGAWAAPGMVLLLGAGVVRAGEAIQLEVDASQAEAVLAILERPAAGGPVPDADWARLFATEPYVRLKRREQEMKRPFDDAAFREFVLSDALRARGPDLRRTLHAWTRTDLEASARRVLAYLPPQARIRAKVYPVIKPQPNTFVFDARTNPAIFLYLDPSVPAERFENTVAHELHHIGLASVSAGAEALLDGLPPAARTAAQWMGAFGEGMAMLAAAGGAGTHPHVHSAPEDRARWDRDVAQLDRDLRLVEAFFLDVIDGRLAAEDQVREKAFAFFGEQGPWYTVGWKMAAVVEQRYGRGALTACMLDPRRLLATFNEAAAAAPVGERLPTWSPRLLAAVGAQPVPPHVMPGGRVR